MTLATRMAVMNAGVIEQVGAPLEIYERPSTTFVAQFVGTPSMNLWPAEVSRDGGAARATADSFALDLPMPVAARAMASPAGVVIGVRPQDVDVAPPGRGDADGEVALVEALGAWTTLHVRAGAAGGLVRVAVLAGPAARPGERIGLRIRRDRLHVFDAASGRNLQEGA